MRYDKLTKEQKAQLDEVAIANIEADHYSNSLALKRAEAIGDETQIEFFTGILAGLEKQKNALVKK